jgi:hypothetical protein
MQYPKGLKAPSFLEMQLMSQLKAEHQSPKECRGRQQAFLALGSRPQLNSNAYLCRTNNRQTK